MNREPILIIADDLTGACDAAVSFAAAGEEVRVRLIPPLNGVSGRVRGLTTNTRDVEESEAEKRIRELVNEAGSEVEVFKKVDSVFRGNTILEISAAVRHWKFDVAVIASAYPALGRRVLAGVLWVEDAAGERSVPIEGLLAEAGVFVKRIAAGTEQHVAAAMSAAIEDGARAFLCDAAVQSDLERIVAGARSLQKRILWIGSGGLARALAAKTNSEPEVMRRRRGRVVYFVGSRHAVTESQVECLKKLESKDGASGIVVRVAMGQTTEEEIRRTVADLMAERVGCLFMTGGDTALFVCRVLGVESIRLEREFAEGVPLGTVEGGAMDGVTVVLKSGGFGEVNLMCRVLEEFGVKQEVTV
ncbi:MAG TPA: four-carbon acid sugar kinase family protein [Candidatus Aquilonibacter sp.]|nr:four-carbon acid sugar kinase family protein [Candidatus Aquilonibacter sp.]